MLSAPSELERSALDAAPDAMIIIDQRGSILFANRQLSALFGYEHDEVVGQPIEQLMPDRFAILPVIFITGHGDVPMAVEAMQHGAFDFLQKPFRDQDLIDRIQRALAKGQAGRAELRERSRIKERLETLTARDREVLDLVTTGKPNKIMAADLGVSQRTVEIYRARVMEKMDASSLAQLVRMVLDLKDGAVTAA